MQNEVNNNNNSWNYIFMSVIVTYFLLTKINYLNSNKNIYIYQWQHFLFKFNLTWSAKIAQIKTL